MIRGLRHSGTDALVIIDAFSDPATAMKEQHDRQAFRLLFPWQVDPYRNLIVIIIYLIIHGTVEYLHRIDRLKIREMPGSLYLYSVKRQCF
ncbi:hypothetical protein SDC9_204419 [bioreactor metagenome]|uniref:Uncharacterized protein n=1 Tax=bioreactor metagenome TaxID=1076179 RepID=A0A645IZZ4_9ZZZZ